MTPNYCRSIPVAVTVALSMTFAEAARAQQHGTIEAASPIQDDANRSAAAQPVIAHSPLPRSENEVAMKAAADRASAEIMKSASPAQPGAASSASAPAVVGALSFAGQNATNTTPSDATGAIGPLSYIQLVNTTARIYNRTTHGAIATGTLNQLANIGSANDSFHPQILWDPTTNRFYYVMLTVMKSPTEFRLSFGFSKTDNPTSFTTTDWCKYLTGPPIPAGFPISRGWATATNSSSSA